MKTSVLPNESFHFKRQWGKEERDTEETHRMTDRVRKRAESSLGRHTCTEGATEWNLFNTNTHAATEHASTHALTHSVRLTGTQRPIDAQTCTSLPAGGGMASDWTQVVLLISTHSHSVRFIQKHTHINRPLTHTHTFKQSSPAIKALRCNRAFIFAVMAHLSPVYLFLSLLAFPSFSLRCLASSSKKFFLVFYLFFLAFS